MEKELRQQPQLNFISAGLDSEVHLDSSGPVVLVAFPELQLIEDNSGNKVYYIRGLKILV